MNLREGGDYEIYGISSIYSLVAKIIFELVDFLCGIGHPFKGFFLLLKSSERLYQCTTSAHVHHLEFRDSLVGSCQ